MKTQPLDAPPSEHTAIAAPLSVSFPQRYAGRIRGLDLARGLAILGMIWAHVKPYTVDETAWQVLAEIPSGRSSALFALLAGVSIAILTGRNVPYSGEHLRYAQLRITGRAVMLLVFASLLGIFWTPIAIILDFYAVWFLLSLPLVHWSAKKLAISSVVVALVGPQLIVLISWLLERNEMWGDGFLHTTLVSGMYPGLAYMAYVLAGIALGRLDLTQTMLRTQLLIIGPALAVLSYGFSWVATKSFASEAEQWKPSFDIGLDPIRPATFITAIPHSNTTFEVVGNLGVGLAIVGACLWLAPLARHVLLPIAAVGSMSLTAYVGHAVFLHFKQDWFFGDSAAPFLWVAGGVLVFCTVWALLPWRRGPLEWVTWRFSQWFARPALIAPAGAR